MNEDRTTEDKTHRPAGEAGFRGPWIRQFLAVALGYVGAGLLSQLIAGPLAPWWPIWLSSGIGFVAILVWGVRQWPGVFAGATAAFLILFRHEPAGSIWNLNHFLGCAGGAAGAVATAIFGAVLARRWAGWPSRLDRARRISWFLAGGVLIGPVPGAAIAIPSWIAAGLLPADNWLFSLVGFYLAQALGVCSTILLLLLKPGEPRSLWKRREFSLGIPMAIALAGTVILLSYEARSIADRIELRFQDRAGRIAAAIDRTLGGHLESIESLRSFWDSSIEVDRREFRVFSKGPLERHSSFEALGWAPEIVPERAGQLSQLARSEATGSGGGSPDRKTLLESFSVRKERLIPGNNSTGSADMSAPVFYLEPVAPNGIWLGLDLKMDPEIAAAMELSKATGAVTATAPFSIADSGRQQVLICGWIERGKNPPENPADWLQDQSGFALGILNVSHLIDAGLAGDTGFPVALSVVDDSDEGAGTIPFHSAGVPGADKTRGARSDIDIGFAERTWRFQFSSGTAGIAGGALWESAIVQAGVLLVMVLLGTLLLVATGHTARVEQDVRDRSRELAESEERFRQLSENIEEVFWMTNADGLRIEYVSPGFEKIWGRKCEDLYESAGAWLEGIHPEDRPRVEVAYQGVAEGEFDEEYRVIRPDGTIRWVRDRGFPVRNEEGKVIRIAGVADDITGLREIMNELNRSNADLRRFAYLASHDLQEPLRMVTSFVQLLERRHGDRLGDEAREYIRHAVDGADRMRSLILGLLELSRIDSRGGALEPIDSAEVLGGAIQNLQIAIAESGAEISIGELPEVKADPAQLTQVFQNLIGNAIKFYDAGGKPEISIAAKRRNGFWEFAVGDNGPGIAPRHHEQIFQIFRRLVPPENSAGSGIGLALCQRIVERHGGEIRLESSGDGGGCIFYFTLPIDKC